MSSCIPLYLLDADDLHSTTALASLHYSRHRMQTHAHSHTHMYIPHYANTFICIRLMNVMVDSIRGRKGVPRRTQYENTQKQITHKHTQAHTHKHTRTHTHTCTPIQTHTTFDHNTCLQTRWRCTQLHDSDLLLLWVFCVFACFCVFTDRYRARILDGHRDRQIRRLRFPRRSRSG